VLDGLDQEIEWARHVREATGVPRTEDRFVAAVAAIDAANADDPNVLVVDGAPRPKEQAHAEMMTAWLERLDPDADEAQRLAARAHHLRRWSLPRDAYPDGRQGYLKWRTALKRRHADEVADLLAGVGYDRETIERVQAIVSKRGLGRDAAVQTHEDALCLVFLETQYDELIERLGDDKAVDVVRKTLAKMSPDGRARAASLTFSAREQEVLERALVSEAGVLGSPARDDGTRVDRTGKDGAP
jgi:hypothetical protein